MNVDNRLVDESVEVVGPAILREVVRLAKDRGLKAEEVEAVLSEVLDWAISVFFE